MGAAASSPALLLACGNSLRQDDAVGLRIVAAQQFTPEMAADLAQTELVIFVDASASDEPGAIRVTPVAPCVACHGPDASASDSPGPVSPDTHSLESHHLDPAALLTLAQTLCGHAPARAFILTIGASHFGYGEDLSGPLRQAVPSAVRLVKCLVAEFSRTA